LEERLGDQSSTFRRTFINYIHHIRDGRPPCVRPVCHHTHGCRRRDPVCAVCVRPVAGHRGHPEPFGRVLKDGRAMRAVRLSRDGRLLVSDSVRARPLARIQIARLRGGHTVDHHRRVLVIERYVFTKCFNYIFFVTQSADFDDTEYEPAVTSQ